MALSRSLLLLRARGGAVAPRGRRVLPQPTARRASVAALPVAGAQAARGLSTQAAPAPPAAGPAMVSVDEADASLAASAPMATSWKGVRRFYAHVGVAGPFAMPATSSTPPPPAPAPAAKAKAGAAPPPRAAEGWRVLVQGRALRTHGMRDLLVPSRALAVAIAGEFAAQGEHVLPATTPLYNLASSAIDQFVHEDLAAAEDIEAEMRAARLSTFDRIAAAGAEGGGGAAGGGGAGAGSGADVLALARASEADAPAHARSMSTGRSEGGGMGGAGSGTSKLRDLALDYLETDSVCFRVDWDLSDPGERLLRKRQDKHYGPLLAWFAEAHGAPLAVAVGLEDARHPEAAFDAAEDAIDCADPWLKAFYGQTLGCLKSTVLAMALAHRAVDAEEAFAAARVEEEYQLESFGFVEDGHDTGRAYLRLQLASAAAFLALLPRASLPAPLPSAGAGAGAGARARAAAASARASASAGGGAAYEAALAAHIAARTARVAARRAREAALVARKREAFRQIARDAAAAARA